MCRRMKTDSYCSPYTRISSTCIKHLNIRPQTIEVLEKNIEEKLNDSGLDSNFSDMTFKAQKMKVKIDKSDCIK